MTVHLCDVNIWLALALSAHRHHRVAADWLEGIDEPRSILFCRSTQQALVRLLSNAAVLAPYGIEPLSNRAAWSVYQAFIHDDRIALQTEEPVALEENWQRYAVRDTASPKLWMDAFLAAFALAEGYRLVTTDGGYHQFGGLDLLVLGD